MAGISSLQQAALSSSAEFQAQVNSVVKEQALIKAAAADDTGNQNLLANVIRNPESYGFPSALVADSVWAITYDVWAADPTSADYLILAGVQRWFSLLTGYTPPVPPAGSP